MNCATLNENMLLKKSMILKSQKLWAWENFVSHQVSLSIEQLFPVVFSHIIKNGDILSDKVKGNTKCIYTYISKW